ncbi:MAG: hypothetical protein GDA53_10800 [Rhodobacteraceae bacterium]|nr:hypothetical protein [Paracoccaceae bacterium]
MTSAIDRVADLYRKKQKDGLTNVKFFVDNPYKATEEGVCEEVLRLEKAIQNGDFVPLTFNDCH